MRNMRRLLALLLALCMTAAVPGVAFAGDWGAILENTEEVWNATYYCEGCGLPLSIRAGVEPTATMHVRVWHCANSSCDEYYANPADGSAEFYTVNGRHTFDATGTCYCGYYDSSQATCSHTSCDYSYTYYNGTYHRYVQTCLSCGTTVSSTLQGHSTTSDCVYEDASTHSHETTCTLCDTLISSTSEEHSWNSTYAQYNANQHKITHKCGGCLYSSVSYGNHSDSDSDGKCDSCGYKMSTTLTWNLGTGSTTVTTQNYNTNLVLPSKPTRAGYTFMGWFTAATGGTQVTGSTVFTTSSATTYYAQWELISVFSVSVPATLPLAMDEYGEVYTADVSIKNNSTAAVKVTGITVTAQNGWVLVPYSTNMAKAKVDAKQVGFSLNSSKTTATGSSQTLTLSGSWTIAKSGSLALDYDAVISAVSEAVTNEAILVVVFVLDWA